MNSEIVMYQTEDGLTKHEILTHAGKISAKTAFGGYF